MSERKGKMTILVRTDAKTGVVVVNEPCEGENKGDNWVKLPKKGDKNSLL